MVFQRNSFYRQSPQTEWRRQLLWIFFSSLSWPSSNAWGGKSAANCFGWSFWAAIFTFAMKVSVIKQFFTPFTFNPSSQNHINLEDFYFQNFFQISFAKSRYKNSRFSKLRSAHFELSLLVAQYFISYWKSKSFVDFKLNLW